MNPRVFRSALLLLSFAALQCAAQTPAAHAASAAPAGAGAPKLWQEPLPTAGDQDALRFSNGAEMFRDVTYETILGYRPLKLDLYLPSAKLPAQPLPLVVWVHGGGWEQGNPRVDWTYGDWTQVLARLSARGYVVAGVTYRFRAEAPFPAQIDDIHAALRFLRKNAARWGIDPSRVYIWGLSAGGHLAALAGTESATAAAEERVEGVADWFGPTDFSTFDTKGPKNTIGAFLGCPDSGCTPEVLRKASPVSYVSPQAPPTLIMQGDDDKLVPLAQGQALYDRLHAAGVDVRFLHFAGQGHGFTGATPAELQQDLETVFAFFDQLSHSSKP
jgi:acetyl esterase/lipase